MTKFGLLFSSEPDLLYNNFAMNDYITLQHFMHEDKVLLDAKLLLDGGEFTLDANCWASLDAHHLHHHLSTHTQQRLTVDFLQSGINVESFKLAGNA